MLYRAMDGVRTHNFDDEFESRSWRGVMCHVILWKRFILQLCDFWVLIKGQINFRNMSRSNPWKRSDNYFTLPLYLYPLQRRTILCRMLNVCWVAVRCTVLCEWKYHHLRIHEYNLCTLKIRLIHTGYTSLSNQVKTIHNDCPDITYKIGMLHVLEKIKKTHHCLKSKSLCSYG